MAQKGTTHGNNIRVGKESGLAATRTIGSVALHQRWEVSAVPASGTSCFVLPTSAEITYFDVVIGTAYAGEATVRFGAVGTGGSNLYGQVSVSGAAVYTLGTPGTATSVWTVGASSQPIGISVVSASGQISTLANNITAKVFYTRKYQQFDT
jgi:hypothetical protein